MTRPRTGFPFLDAGLDQPGSVLAFAHRGGALHPANLGLENTLTAFENAVALGYDYLETDVHVTRDGVLVAFHDRLLDRMTDRTGALADLPYAEVARARIHGREPIPTLAALFERFPTTRFNLDMKAPGVVDPLVGLIRSTGRRDSVCVGSFSDRTLAAFRRLADDRVVTSCGRTEVAARRFLRRRHGAGAVLQVPHRYGAVAMVTRSFVEHAHAAGTPVHVWTVDDPEEMAALLDLGVDGLMTDRTDLLHDLLVRRGQWREAA